MASKIHMQANVTLVTRGPKRIWQNLTQKKSPPPTFCLNELDDIFTEVVVYSNLSSLTKVHAISNLRANVEVKTREGGE